MSTAPEVPPLAIRGFDWPLAVSHGLVLALCAAALLGGLLPGLLAVCASYLFTRWVAKMSLGFGHKVPVWMAAAVIMIAPLAGLSIFFADAKNSTVSMLGQHEAMMNHLASTVLQIRGKMPTEIARHLPDGVAAIQEMLAQHLRSQASVLASMGRTWIHGVLLAYVGLVVGALLAANARPVEPKPLSMAIAERARTFIDAFRQIVAAQFCIAAFNAVLTAIFLWVVLPLFRVHMPYAVTLVAMTFFLGLVPIVGNLMVNASLSLVGLSVSPAVGLACLVFLITIHKFEYAINAIVIGSRTRTAVWELLAVMFIFETLFGFAGLVAAPLYYAHLKKELVTVGWV